MVETRLSVAVQATQVQLNGFHLHNMVLKFVNLLDVIYECDVSDLVALYYYTSYVHVFDRFILNFRRPR